MQNKVLNEVAIEQMDDLIKAVKGGSSGFDVDGTLPELQDGEVTDPLMAVGNDGKAKKLPVKTLFGKYNLRGSGNIDLYRHNISIQVKSGVETKGYIYINYISSENTIVDTLTDLRTLIKEFTNNFVNVPCSGYYLATSATASPVIGLYNEDGAILIIYNDGVGNGSAIISNSVIVDTVTTI